MAEKLENTRTDEEKLLRIGVDIEMGGKSYRLRPLPIRPAIEWLKDYASMMGKAMKVANVSSDEGDKFQDGIRFVLLGMAEECLELLFKWDANLPREEIENSAFPEEIFSAIEICSEMANPPAAAQRIAALGQ